MWLDNLRRMKAASGYTTKEIAEKSGIPDPTLVKLFAGQTKEPKISTLRQLVHFFGASLDDLYDDINSIPLPTEAQKMVSRIERLDAGSRGAVSALISYYEAQAKPEMKVIPLFSQSIAAGFGEPDIGGGFFEDYEVPANSPAEFACRVHGDSLEPVFRDQDIALAVKRQPEIGEVGVFLVDGEYKIKQYVSDCGNVHLYAVNRKREDTDQTLRAEEEHSVYCFGTILMKRVPMP